MVSHFRISSSCSEEQSFPSLLGLSINVWPFHWLKSLIICRTVCQAILYSLLISLIFVYCPQSVIYHPESGEGHAKSHTQSYHYE